MILWRISNYADLLGIGGLEYPARWHNRGVPVVYLAEHPALAMLEVMVHFDLSQGQLPKTFKLLEVSVDAKANDAKIVQHLDSKALSENWQQDEMSTRAIGDEWLLCQSSLLLRVPSAVMPNSFNYLLNPRHPSMKKASIKSQINYPFDTRLLLR